jgi:hypothetical protein
MFEGLLFFFIYGIMTLRRQDRNDNASGVTKMRINTIAIWFILFVLCTSVVFPGKIVPLPGHLHPESVYADGDQIYITEETSIYIYGRGDFKLRKKSGREGEGPQEFKGFASLYVYPDYLLVNSSGRISFFTREGEFIKENNLPFYGVNVRVVGEAFASHGRIDENNIPYRTINFYDAKFKKIKEIARIEEAFQRSKGEWRQFPITFSFYPYKDKIFVIGQEDFVIGVFDENGDKLFDITQKYKRLKVSEEEKKAVHDWFKINPGTRNMPSNIKKMIRFLDYFPAVRDMVINNEKLYVRTYKKSGEKTEFFILDSKGKLLEKVFIPIYERNRRNYYSYSICDGKVYQLIENEDTEEWELHIVPFGRF